MDITLNLNGNDYSDKVTSYSLKKEIVAPKVIVTLDHEEHVSTWFTRDVITFSLMPLSEEDVGNLYADVSWGFIDVIYTDPYAGLDLTQQFRRVTDLNAIFGLRSVDGNRYYKGGEIVLRAKGVGEGWEPEPEPEGEDDSD